MTDNRIWQVVFFMGLIFCLCGALFSMESLLVRSVFNVLGTYGMGYSLGRLHGADSENE